MAEVLNYSSGRSGILVAKPSRDYRWRRYALVGVILFYGIYSAYDGFYHYPKDNNDFREKYGKNGAVKEPHPGFDIIFNQVFGVALPPLALLFLGWVQYNSRGMYRFDGQTLTVPGHPPVQVKAIRMIDRSKWDRKGIALVHYQVPGKADLAILRLDDFIYDRVPVDSIFERLEVLVESNKTAVPGPAAAPR